MAAEEDTETDAHVVEDGEVEEDTETDADVV
jgi:hypothetical protein